MWKDPGKAEEILTEATEKNKEVYDFEKMMENISPSEKALKTPPLTA
jgi:t-SNARE complex subunit (syntaxin)